MFRAEIGMIALQFSERFKRMAPLFGEFGPSKHPDSSLLPTKAIPWTKSRSPNAVGHCSLDVFSRRRGMQFILWLKKWANREFLVLLQEIGIYYRSFQMKIQEYVFTFSLLPSWQTTHIGVISLSVDYKVQDEVFGGLKQGLVPMTKTSVAWVPCKPFFAYR